MTTPHSSKIKEQTKSSSEIWHKVAERLKFLHGEATFNSWLKPLTVVDSNDANTAEVTMIAPTRFMKEWILSHYLEDIRKFWQEENSALLSIEIRTSTSGVSSTVTQHHETAVASEHKRTIPSPATSISNSASSFYNLGYDNLRETLDERFTFDNFVVGASNELAHAAARGVAEAKSAVPGSNPLFLYGGVGLGKTHLMQAIAWHILENDPKRKVLYLSAEKFMYQFVKALRNKDIVSFKEYFRSVDVLMVDDIQFICGKNNTQEEFFHTFNALIENNRQLILSGDRSPSDLEGLEDRVKSRLGWGLVADINKTTFELRLSILQSKIEHMEISVPKEVLEFLARKVNSNVRELEGALNKVIAHSNLIHREITIEGTREILSDLLRSVERVVTIDDIKKTVAEHCNIRISDMHSARRARSVARPRQIAMYLSKRLTSHSLPEIGRNFGGKDHTTVMHAVKRVEELCEKDSDIRTNVEILTRALQY